MKEYQQHIQQLFESRGRDDPNSTTLANTLDKDIQTVFNSIEKFVFELLQNADDAGLPNCPVEMSFLLREDHLIFSHNGKHFDPEDVEAICDNAQRKKKGKEVDLEKTGYKGIGFKSVFVITDCVYIFSGEYTFRFDRHFLKWQEHAENNLDGHYPWQIVPIWTPADAIPLRNSLDPAKVNFVLAIRKDPNTQKALMAIVNNPHIILFLRRTRIIHVDFNGNLHTIRLEKNHDIRSLYIDDQLVSAWLILEKRVDIPESIHEQLQLMGAHECPEKLKQTQYTSITFAAKIAGNKLVATEQATLYCYLPTTVNCGLPFLVNADFLLSADRTQLLKNGWNQYLFGMIAQLLINWLSELAQSQSTRDQILVLFIRNLASHIVLEFSTEYQRVFESTLRQVAFIPSYSNPLRLLKFGEAVVDNTEFYPIFPGIEPEFETTIVRYELEAKTKLARHFNLFHLIEKIERFAQANRTLEFQERLLTFLLNKIHLTSSLSGCLSFFNDSSGIAKLLSRKKFILSRENSLVSPEKLHLPAQAAISYPTFLKLEFIHPQLLLIEGLKEWLLKLGVKEATIESVFEAIVNRVKEKHEITAADSIEIILFIYPLYVEKKIPRTWLHKLGDLPLLTQTGGLRLAKNCYLPSNLDPDLDLQAMIGRHDLFISEQCMPEGIDSKQLSELFKALGVKSKITFHTIKNRHLPINCWGENDFVIDNYDEYIEHVQSVDGVNFFGCTRIIENFVYCEYLRYMPHLSFARYFWEFFVSHWDEINKTCSNSAIIVSSKKQSPKHFKTTPYLVYFLSKNPCIRTRNGTLCRTQDLYSPVIISKLGERLGQIFPQMILNFEGFRLALTEEQAVFFRFKNKISVEDCLKLLKFIEQDDSQYAQEHYTKIFDVMMNQAFSSAEIEQLKESNVKLLAANNTLKPAAALFYYPSDSSLKDIQSENFLKFSPGFSSEQMLTICHLFHVHLLGDENLSIQYAELQVDNRLKNGLLQRVPFWALMEEAYTKRDQKELQKTWLEKLIPLEICSVDTLIVTWEAEQTVLLQPKIFMHGNKLYYVNDNSRVIRGLLKTIVKYLDISDKTLAAMMETAEYNEQEFLTWLHEEGFDTGILSRREVFREDQSTISATGVISWNELGVELSERNLVFGEPDAFVQPVASVPDIEAHEVDCRRITFTRQASQATRSLGLFGGLREIEPTPEIEPTQPMRIHATGRSVQRMRSQIVSSKDWTGGWGEEIVFYKLKAHYQEKYTACMLRKTTQGFILEGKDNQNRDLKLEVIWYNKNGESGRPADIEIIKNGRSRYVEVKSTHKSNQNTVFISRNEWQLMQSAGNRYRIFCVYNAGKPNAHIVKIKDPVAKLAAGELMPHEIQFKL